MTGGTTIRNESEAKAVAARLQRRVDVGEKIAEDPCLPKHYLAQFEAKGRPCPRVVLNVRNEGAASLSSLSFQPHLRHLITPFALSVFAEMDTHERIAMMRRVGRALSSSAVMAKLYPKDGGSMDSLESGGE